MPSCPPVFFAESSGTEFCDVPEFLNFGIEYSRFYLVVAHALKRLYSCVCGLNLVYMTLE